MTVLIGIGIMLLVIFAIVGVVFSSIVASEYLEDWWDDNTTRCRRCESRGVWQYHFCHSCGEKIEKLIGEKW